MFNYKFIEESYSKERNFCDCIVINKQIGDDYIFKHYSGSSRYNPVTTLAEFFHVYQPCNIPFPIKKLAECFCSIDVEQNSAELFWNWTETKRGLFLDEVAKKFKETIPGIINSDMEIYVTHPKSNWVKNYQILLRSEKLKTIFKFDVKVPNRKDAKQFILDYFKLPGLRTKVNKGKTFKTILEENDLELLIFATEPRNSK